MAFLKVKNNAESTLASGINASATSLTVASGEGAKFPTDNFHISIDDEILKCTSRSGDTFTVQRGKEGTTAASHDAGAKVQLRWTAGYVEELQTALSDVQAVNAGPFLLVAQNGLSQEIPSVWTKMQFNQVITDTHNAWDSQNNRFICPVAGYYIIIGRGSIQNLSDGKRMSVSVMINGDENQGGRIFDTWLGGQGNCAGAGAVFMYLNQNDYVELYIYHSDTSNKYTVGYPKTDALTVIRIA